MNKPELRAKIKEEKSNLPEQFILDYSAKISRLFFSLPAYKEANVIYTYVAFNNEIITEYIIEQALKDGKKVAVPKVECPGIIEFYYITDLASLQPGTYNILEPNSLNCQKAEDKDFLMIIPGLAFDKNHNRLGYGGGYYDRFIKRAKDSGKNLKKIAVAYPFQVVSEIPAMEFDEKVDIILTADEIV